MDVLFLLILILLNGVFAMSEIALVTAKKSRLQQLAHKGDKGAAMAVKLGENPTRFLSTIQIGITSIGVLSGIVGEAVLAAPLARFLQSLGLPVAASSVLATGVVVLLVTYFSIVLGELVPKRIAQINAEPIARMMSRPLSWVAVISYPFILLLSFSTDTILRLFGKQKQEAELTEEDIAAVLEEGSMLGVLEQNEHEMMRNVFRLDERHITSFMTPRGEIVYLDTQKTPEENMALILQSNHSRFPVCHGDLDNIGGVIHAKNLLRQHMEAENVNLEKNLAPCVYVPESLSGLRLLEIFRTGTQMVFVVNEYGDVLGLITIKDVLEGVTGQLQEEDETDTWAVRREDGSWLFDGSIPLVELADRLNLSALPSPEKRAYNTLGGMMMDLLHRVPQTGEKAEWEQWVFEVVDMDGQRIDKILALPRV